MANQDEKPKMMISCPTCHTPIEITKEMLDRFYGLYCSNCGWMYNRPGDSVLERLRQELEERERN